MSTREPEPFPFETLPSDPADALKASALFALGTGLMVVPFLASFLGMIADPEFVLVSPLLLALVGLPCSMLGATLIQKGRRYRVPRARDLLLRDPRAPVLFLRSFQDEELIDPRPPMVPLGGFFRASYEERLCRQLAAIGPVVCIGRPGERLPPLGAARFYVTDDIWRRAVEHLAANVAIVVLVVGTTPGVRWEQDFALRGVPPERLLLFFPYAEDPDRRHSWWRRVTGYAPHEVPFEMAAFRRMNAERNARYEMLRAHFEDVKSKPLPAELGTAQFLDFDCHGEPRLLTSVRPWWALPLALGQAKGNLYLNLPATLRPFFDKVRVVGPHRFAKVQNG